MLRQAHFRLALCLPLLVACQREQSPPFEAGVCMIASPHAGYVRLDDVDNLETCGARLEVVYLRRRRPVAGAYGGVYVYVDANSIDAASPNGPRTQLIDPRNRRRVDADIRLLLRANGEDTGEQDAAANRSAAP